MASDPPVKAEFGEKGGCHREHLSYVAAGMGVRSMNIEAFVFVLCFAVSGVIAAPALCRQAQAGPFGRIETDGARFELERDGRFSLVFRGKTLVSRGRLLVAGVGWRGTGSQEGCRIPVGYPRKQGNAYVFRGEITERASNTTWKFEQRVEPSGNGVRFVYEIEPDADTVVAEVALFIHLPVKQWSGKRVVLWPTAEAVFPPDLPRNRHFMNGPAQKVLLGSPDTYQMSISFTEPVFCTLQDARAFKEQAYHIYPKIFAGGRAKAGQRYRMEFVLVPDDKKEYAVRGVPLECTGAPRIDNVSVNTTSVPQYGKFEVTFDLTGTWDNPFDPSQVAVDGVFRAPDGKGLVVPGFLFQDYERTLMGGGEMLMPKHEPVWKVRFAPTVPGRYGYSLRVTNQGKTIETEERKFQCTRSKSKHGFLRVSEENGRYFQFDDGTPFFGVGMNIATLGAGRTVSAERWYTRLAGVGGNLVRSWWCSGGTDIESRLSNRPDQGLGKYKLDEAWRIDYVLDLAERLGIYMMCCFETQQYLRRDKWWPQFTYNVANGGPATSPADYFVNQEVDKYFRHRLRYIVARWSYSTSVYAWQFWNEVSACNNFHAHNAARWHGRMARYLRSIDPFDHIIHTNFGNLDGYAQVDGLPEMEVVSTNTYSRRDMGQTGIWGTRWMTSRYPDKPFLITEYGVGHRGGWVGEDPTGIIVHNGLWGPVMCGSAATGLPWGWSHWIDVQNMYHYWESVSAVVEDIPFCKRQWQPVKVASFTFRNRRRRPYYAGVFFEGWPRNYSYRACPDPRPDKFHITAEGEIQEQESLGAGLWPSQKHTFAINFPVDTHMRVHVPEIADRGSPLLEVVIDGNTAFTRRLARDTERPWEYWKSFAVQVSAGQHVVTVRNAGSGAMWTAYEIEEYRYREGPDLDVVGTYTDDYVLVWLRNPQFIWIYAREGREVKEQEQGLLTLQDIPGGRYAVVWRETTTNEVLARTTASASRGRLTLSTPRITRSAVAKLVRQE